MIWYKSITVTIGRNLFKRSFSKIVVTVVKMFIGQYDVNLLGGFPVFGLRMICAFFLYAGKYLLSKTPLNNWVRYFFRVIGSSLRILLVMRS
jgi:hypothetical protein